MFLLLAAAIGLTIGLIVGALGAGGGMLTHRDRGRIPYFCGFLVPENTDVPLGLYWPYKQLLAPETISGASKDY